MAIFRDVVVNIQRLTAAPAVPNYGLCLIVTTESTNAYKEYSDLASVTVDYTSTTQAYMAAAALFGQNPAPDKVAIVGIQQTTAITDVIDGLNQVRAAHGGFTFMVSDATQMADIQALADWATANNVFYVATITQAEIDTLINPVSDYVVIMVHDDKEQYPEAALIGRCSTFQPGSATWMFKTLNGITPMEYDDQNTMVELINEKHYMTYVTKHGMNMTTGGYVTSGEYMDVMLGVLWIKETMEVAIQQLLVNTPKVPYTNTGIALIASEVESVLRQGAENGIIRTNIGGVGEYTLNIPDVADISTVSIANRELNDITWVAYLAGAIHHVEINGVVQY